MLSSCAAAPAGVRIQDAWVRPTPPGTDEASIYLVVSNGLAADVFVTGGAAAPCMLVSVHLTETGADGVSTMGDADGRVTRVPAGGQLRFEPLGLHLMCHGLAAPLVEGDHFALTVEFQGADPRTVDVVVTDR